MAITSGIQQFCPYCNKKGLPILLTRYGIAPEKAFSIKPGNPPATRAAPRAAASVGDPSTGDSSVGLPASSGTYYTVRTLRGGYVYVYYEQMKKNAWEAYAVDKRGYLASTPVSDFTDMAPPGKAFDQACMTDMQKVANASLITIQAPEHAGKVWFGFSDVWWTPAVRKNIEKMEAITRKDHMRCVDISTWYNGNRPARAPQHTSPITSVENVVADYAMSDHDQRHLFAWNPFLQPEPPMDLDQLLHQYQDSWPDNKYMISTRGQSRSSPNNPWASSPPSDFQRSLVDFRQAALEPQTRFLMAESRQLMKDKGLVVVLDDPVAILQEISTYIGARWKNFTTRADAGDPLYPQQTWHRKLALGAALDTLKLHVEREAEDIVYANKAQMKWDNTH